MRVKNLKKKIKKNRPLYFISDCTKRDVLLPIYVCTFIYVPTPIAGARYFGNSRFETYVMYNCNIGVPVRPTSNIVDDELTLYVKKKIKKIKRRKRIERRRLKSI